MTWERVKNFGTLEEGLIAYENKVVGLHAIVNVRAKGSWIKKLQLAE